MARRRKEKTLPEMVFGILIFVVIIAVINPKNRALAFSGLTSLVALLILVAIIGFAIYLFKQVVKKKKDPAPTWNRDSSRFYIKPPETYYREFFRTNHRNQSNSTNQLGYFRTKRD